MQRTDFLKRVRFRLEVSPLTRYAIALMTVVIALVMRYFIHTLAGNTLSLYQTFFLAVIFCAWQLGVRPAIFASVLGWFFSVGFVQLWFSPAIIFNSVYIVEFGLYVLICFLIIWIIDLQQKARIRADYRRGTVEHMVDQLWKLKRENDQVIRQLDRQTVYFESVLHQMPSGVIISSADGETVTLNKRASSILGEKVPSIRAMQKKNPFHVKNLNDGGEVSVEEYPLSRALRGDVVTGAEDRIEIDGALKVLRASAAPIYDVKGTLIAAAMVFDDVTEAWHLRQQLETALEEADRERRRLQAVLDILPIGVSIAGMQGELVYMNEGARRVWGEDAPRVDSTEGYREYKGWRADTGEALTSETWALARALKRGDVTPHEILNIERFDGTPATIVNAATPIRDADGNIIGGVATNTDITREYQVRRDLQESEDRYRALWNVGFEVRLVHQNMVFVDVNDAYLALVGYTRDEVIGCPVKMMFANDEDYEVARQAMQQDYQTPYQVRLRRKNGSIRLVEAIGKNVLYSGGVMRLVTLREKAAHETDERAG